MKNAACKACKSLLKTNIETPQMPKMLGVAIFDHKMLGAWVSIMTFNSISFAPGFFEGKPRRKRTNKNLTPVTQKEKSAIYEHSQSAGPARHLA